MQYQAKIYLCNVDFDTSFSHLIDFESGKSQIKYFNSLQGKTMLVNSKVDAFRESLTLKCHIDDIIQYDYLILFTMESKKNYYYFINEKIQVTENSCQLTLQLDPWQTYMFDFYIDDSFVDRMHVNRWYKNGKPTENYIDEGLEYGHTKLLNEVTLKNCDFNYIVATTTPIGKLEIVGGGGGEPEPPTGGNTGDWRKGIVSSKSFRFMKGYEGFASKTYKDPVGVLTIGYGTTDNDGVAWNELTSKQPISEELASKTMYNRVNKNYGGLYLNQMISKFNIDSQQKFDALTDLVYNGGPDTLNLKHSLPRALKERPNDEAYIRPIWEKYWTNGGLPGLAARRKAECDIYFKGVYEKRNILKIMPNGSYNGTVTENNGNGWLPDNGGDTEQPTNFPTVSNDYGTGWVIPVPGTVTAIFPNYSSGAYHGAIDIACNTGTPVRCSKNGVVIKRRELTTSFGKYLFVEHSPGVITIYAHNSKLLVNEGDKVTRGQIIAYSGNTGNSTGAHLHWGLRVDGVDRNPAPSLKKGQVIKY